jgi:micrococcal nuclease
MSIFFRNSLSAITLLAICAFSTSVKSHPGRTNAESCHNDRSTGTYHCHNGGSSPSASTTDGSATQTGQVVSVGDGDTIRVRRDDETMTVRLACIDAPEMRQSPFGQGAKERLQLLAPVNSTVSLRTIDTDRYGRLVAEVFREDSNINLSLVSSGHAVVYRQYLSNCDSETYLAAEAIAQQDSRVFWSQANPVMPWDFRRQ